MLANTVNRLPRPELMRTYSIATNPKDLKRRNVLHCPIASTVHNILRRIVVRRRKVLELLHRNPSTWRKRMSSIRKRSMPLIRLSNKGLQKSIPTCHCKKKRPETVSQHRNQASTGKLPGEHLQKPTSASASIHPYGWPGRGHCAPPPPAAPRVVCGAASPSSARAALCARGVAARARRQYVSGANRGVGAVRDARGAAERAARNGPRWRPRARWRAAAKSGIVFFSRGRRLGRVLLGEGVRRLGRD